MMRPLDDLLPASFKGVPFFVKNEERKGGRKLKIFEYPLTKNRTIQDLGNRFPIFTVAAVVCGEDWLKDAANLRQVCESQNAGNLILPSFGVYSATCMEIKERVIDTAHGMVTLDLTFAVVKEGYINIGVWKRKIEADGAKVMSEISLTFAEKISDKKSTIKFIGLNKDVMVDDFSQLSITLNETIPQIEAVTRTFMDRLNTVISRVNALTNELLREGMLGMIMNSLPADGSAFGTVKKLWTFGNQLRRTLPSLLADIYTLSNLGLSNAILGPYGIPTWLRNTASRRQRTDNRIAIVAAVRCTALACTLDQAAKADYMTSSQMDTRVREIEEAFQNIVYDPTLELSSTLITALEQMKATCYRILDGKREKAYKIKQATVKRTTSALLAYTLYNEEVLRTGKISDYYAFSDYLGRLNPTQRRDKLEGTVDVLEVQ